MCLIENGQSVYPLDIVRTMRDQRAMMIQTPVSTIATCTHMDRFLIISIDYWLFFCAEPVPIRLRGDPESFRGGDRKTVWERTYRTYRTRRMKASPSLRFRLLPVRTTLSSLSPLLEGNGHDRPQARIQMKSTIALYSDKQWLKGIFHEIKKNQVTD